MSSLSARSNIRVRVIPKFPADVSGGAGVVVDRQGNSYVISPDFASLDPLGVVTDLTTKFFILQDVANGTFRKISLQDLIDNFNQDTIGPTLTGLSALSVGANQGMYGVAANTFSTYALTAFGRTFSGLADAAAARAALSVDQTNNTSDANKPVSTAQAAAIAASVAGVAPIASPAFTGAPTAPKITQGATGSGLVNADALLEGIATPFLYGGFEPGLVNANVVQFSEGFVSIGQAAPTHVIQSKTVLQCNVSTIGPGGMDVAPAVPATNSRIQFYVLEHPTTHVVTIVGSLAISYTGLSLANLAGYNKTLCRKLRCAFPYLSVGFPAFHTWTDGTVTFDECDDSGYWEPAGGSNVDTAGAWNVVSLARFVPDFSRMALVNFRTDYNSAAGNLRFRPGSGSSSLGTPCGYVTTNSPRVDSAQFWCRLSSAQEIAIQTVTGVRGTLRVAGYKPTSFGD